MKFKELFKKFIYRGATVYTAGSLLILLFSLTLSENSAAKILSPTPFLLFAAYSYLMSFGSTLCRSGAFSPTVLRLIHALCYNVGFFGFALLCSIQFTYAAIFTAIYAIIYIAVSVVVHITNKKRSEKSKSPSRQSEKKPAQAHKSNKEKNQSQATYTNRFS